MHRTTSQNSSSVGPAPEARDLRHLYDREQVEVLLHRERLRADRSGREFSLVVIKPQTQRNRTDQLRLAKLMLDGSRSTDDVGRFDRASVCALLPETDAAGTWCLARRMLDRADERSLASECSVYTYPGTWYGSGGTDHRKSGNNDHHNDGGAPKRASDKTSEIARVDGRGNGRSPALVAREARLAELVQARADYESGSSGAGHSVVSRGDELESDSILNPSPADSGVFDELPAVGDLAGLLVKPLPWWKRVIDIAGATIALTLSSPVLVAAAIAIKLTDFAGPVIFRQQRAGLGGRPFTIYKFRTMFVGAEAQNDQLRHLSHQDGPAFKIAHDPRVTWIGRILRKTSLDELPQFINVLKGDMSLVGPRPLPVKEARACQRWQQRRHDVTPGITCTWQVHARSSVTFDEWCRMDINYIRRRRLFEDLRLIVQTIPAVLSKRGAS